MKIQNFIFAWNQFIPNAIDLESKLSSYGKTTVINSNIFEKRDYWINLNDGYFAEQWNTLVSNIDSDTDFIFHIQADAYFHDFRLIFDRFQTIVKKYNLGVYAPNVHFSHHSYNINKLKKYEDDLYFVPNTDCTCWFIKKTLIDDIHLFDLSTNHIGFGADWYYIAKSVLSNQDVIRDYKYTIQHPNLTNYDTTIALNQYHTWLNNLTPPIKSQIHELMIMRSKLLNF